MTPEKTSRIIEILVNLDESLQDLGDSQTAKCLRQECRTMLLIFGEAIRGRRWTPRLVPLRFADWAEMQQTAGTDHDLRRALATSTFDKIRGAYTAALEEDLDRIEHELIESEGAAQAALLKVAADDPEITAVIKRIMAEESAHGEE